MEERKERWKKNMEEGGMKGEIQENLKGRRQGRPMFYPLLCLIFVSLPFAPFFLHLFLFSTSSLLHLSLIAVLIHFSQQPHSPDQTGLTHGVLHRKKKLEGFCAVLLHPFMSRPTATSCQIIWKPYSQTCYQTKASFPFAVRL